MITLQASALNRIAACNGAIEQQNMSEIPNNREQTDDQREGEAAHFAAMDVVRGVIKDAIEYVERKMPNGVFVTPEMADAANMFANAVFEGSPDFVAWREVETNGDFQLTDTVRILARPDVVAYELNGDLLVPEFKYGYRIVEPSDNWTLIAYAMSAVIRHQIVPRKITLMVVQPRPHHEEGKIRKIELTYPVLLEKYTELQRLIGNPTNDLHSGPHCYKCSGLATCRAARNAGYNSIDVSHKVFHDTMTNEELAAEHIEILRALDMLKQRGDAIEELITHRIEQGAVYQTHALDREQYGHYKFNPGITPELIEMMTKIDISTKGMLTPAKAIAKGVPESVVKSFSTRPKLSAKLVVKSADQRAKKLFGKPNS